MSNDNYAQNPQPQQVPPQYGQGAQQPYQQYQRPSQQMYIPKDEATSTGQWMLTLFLTAIPIVNIIMFFVWAFGSNTAPSKKNWARATLIWGLIAILFSVVISIIAVAMNIPVTDYIRRP